MFQYRYGMRWLYPVLLPLCFSLFPHEIQAQEAASQTLEIGPSGEAYLKSTAYRSIDSDVGYYDPTGALPALETGQEPPPPPAQSRDGAGGWPSGLNGIVIAVAALLLIGLVALMVMGSGNFTLSMQGDAENAVRARRGGPVRGFAGAGPLAELQTILDTADRRRALVMLAQSALARTVAANGVLLQPSWTMRDALRHIPKAQTHLDSLRSLVLAGEWVLFGNRDVTEDEFQAHLAGVRPLMSGGPA